LKAGNDKLHTDDDATEPLTGFRRGAMARDGVLTRVMASCWPSAREPHRSTERSFAEIGPRMIPSMTAGTDLVRLRKGT
jgi:hypothetical protein